MTIETPPAQAKTVNEATPTPRTDRMFAGDRGSVYDFCCTLELDLTAAESALAEFKVEGGKAIQFNKERADAAESRAEAAESGPEGAKELADRLKLEAQCHAQEARTQRSTVHEIYQLITGASGEPANWHGAEPVRAHLSALQSRLDAAERDAGRWNVARQYLTIDDIQKFSHMKFCGHIADTEQSVRADAAIDALFPEPPATEEK